MTSQIALLNGSGIAVASDSAVTFTSGRGGMKRTFPSKSKIYQLPGRQPVGLMTSNVGSYRRIPWSVIFGQFREWYAEQPIRSNPDDPKARADPNRELDTLAEYANDIRDFLSRYPNKPSSDLTTSKNLSEFEKIAFEDELDDFLYEKIPSYKVFEDMKSVFDHSNSSIDLFDSRSTRAARRARKFLESQMDNTPGQTLLTQIQTEVVDNHSKMLEKMSEEESMAWPKEKARIARTYSCLVTPFVERFVNQRLPKILIKPLKGLIYNYLLKPIPPSGYPTTIAIFGFGKLESQPSIISLKVGTWRSGVDSSLICDHKKVSRSSEDQDLDDDIDRRSSWICTFAQDQEITGILRGIHPDMAGRLANEIGRALPNILKPILQDTHGIGEKATRKILQRIVEDHGSTWHIWDNIYKIMNPSAHISYKLTQDPRLLRFHTSIILLSTLDLAKLAESLLEMESTIAYYSRRDRTVGGHTDVATITKEDGFLWLKNKHRVDYTLNPRQDAAPRHSANLK